MRVKQLNDEGSSSQTSGKDVSADPAAQVKIRARRRLIGAAVLLLTAAVVVPIVMDTKPTPWADDIHIQIPAKDSKFEPNLPAPVIRSSGKAAEKSTDKSIDKSPEKAVDKAADKSVEKTLPAPVPEAVAIVNTPPPVVKPAVQPSGNAAATAPLRTPPAPIAKVTPSTPAPLASNAVEKSANKANDKVADILADKPKPAVSGKVIVQAGAFVSEEKIKVVEQQLHKAGFTPYREEIRTEKGVVTRLRFAVVSEQAANQAVAKLALEGLSPKILPPQ